MASMFSRAALMAGVITLAGVGAALAQTHPAPAPDGAPRVERREMAMGGPGMGRMHGRHGPRDPAKHAQHLRDVLQLRPDQGGALTAFLAATAPPTPAAHPHPDMPGTTLQRLAMSETMMAEHVAMFKKRNDAIRAFYGQLTPSQQKAFDALHEGMGPMHGPGMGMGGPGRGMGGRGERRAREMRPDGAGGPDAPDH